MIKSSDWKTMNNPSNPWVDFIHLQKSCSSPHTAPAHQYRTGAFASLKLYATVSFNSRLMSCQQWKGFSTPILYPWIPKHIQQSPPPPPPPPSHQGILIAAGVRGSLEDKSTGEAWRVWDEQSTPLPKCGNWHRDIQRHSAWSNETWWNMLKPYYEDWTGTPCCRYKRKNMQHLKLTIA